MSDFWRIILHAYTLAELEQLQRLSEGEGMRAVDLDRINAYLGRDDV